MTNINRPSVNPQPGCKSTKVPPEAKPLDELLAEPDTVVTNTKYEVWLDGEVLATYNNKHDADTCVSRQRRYGNVPSIKTVPVWPETDPNTAGFIAFAELYKLTPAEAVAVPALFETAAKKTGTTIPRLLQQAAINRRLGLYLAGVARHVISQLGEEG